MTRKESLNRFVWLRSVILFLVAFTVLVAVPGNGFAADLSGCWHGRWESCATGHSGVLQATFVREDDSSYWVHFRGRFFKILPFRYSVLMTVKQKGDVTELVGESYLGRLAGTYSYKAKATETDFKADFSSCKDEGRFIMSRCLDCLDRCCR